MRIKWLILFCSLIVLVTPVTAHATILPAQEEQGSTVYQNISLTYGPYFAALSTNGTFWLIAPYDKSRPSSPVQCAYNGSYYNNYVPSSWGALADSTGNQYYFAGSSNSGSSGLLNAFPNSSYTRLTYGTTNTYNPQSYPTDLALDANGNLYTCVEGYWNVQRTWYAGPGSNWSSILYDADAIVALKNNGTLWEWGRFSNGSLSSPVQIGSDSNWVYGAVVASSTFGTRYLYALKSNGTLWYMNISSESPSGLCQINGSWAKTAMGMSSIGGTAAFIKSDGTLWVSSPGLGTTVTQIGSGNTWINVYELSINTTSNFLAEKSDGTLWVWSGTGAMKEVMLGSVPFVTPVSSSELLSNFSGASPQPTATQTASVSVTAGNFGVTPLSSLINLGSIAPSSTALAAGSDIRVDDERGTGAGWHLMVSAPQLQNAAGQKLPSGSLMLQDPSIAVVGDSASTYPLLQVNQFLVDTGSSTEVASAAVGTGMGSYKIGFDHADSARLTVPASTYAGTYSTALTWQLVSGP